MHGPINVRKALYAALYADTYLDTAPLARPVYAEGTILPFSHSIQLLLYDIQTQGIDH